MFILENIYKAPPGSRALQYSGLLWIEVQLCDCSGARSAQVGVLLPSHFFPIATYCRPPGVYVTVTHGAIFNAELH